MKTRTWGKAILALLLAVLMVLPSLAAIAEDPEPTTVLGDLKELMIDADEEGVKYSTNGSEPTEKAESVITAGNIESTEPMPLVEIEAKNGTVDVTVGKVTATETGDSNPYEFAVFIKAKESDVSFASDQIVSTETAIYIDNVSGKVTATTGEIEARDDDYGIILYNSAGTVMINSGDIEAGFTGVNANSSSSGTTTINSGDIEAGSTGVNAYSSSSGTTTINTGAIEAVNYGAYISNTDGTAIVTTGEISAEKYGVAASALGVETPTKAQTTVTVKGDLTVANEKDEMIFGVFAGANMEGASTDFSVKGNISVKNEKEKDPANSRFSLTGTSIYAKASNGAAIDGKVTGTVSAEGYQAIAVRAETESGGSVSLDIGGQVSATGEKDTSGIKTENKDGEIIVNVTGNVVSSGTGIIAEDRKTTDYSETYTGTIIPDKNDTYDPSHNNIWLGYKSFTRVIDGKTVFYRVNDQGEVTEAWYETEREGGTTRVTVAGNVQAEETAIDLDLTEAESAIEVTVSETVEGKKHAIVLSEDTIAENLTMTVWEVKPNEDGNIVERSIWVAGENGEDDKEVFTVDKEAEKLIQYIIRIQDDSKPFIATAGTRDFTAGNGEKYQVANEGDKVLVKLTIPEGKELVGAYWDKAQSEAGKLLVDPATGDYYVEVPRGGGVELSLVMKDLPKPDPKPESEAKSETKSEAKSELQTVTETRNSVATPILTVTELNNSGIEMKFYRNGDFTVTLPDSSKENGTFAFKNDKLVLSCASGRITVNPDEVFVYTCSRNSQTYQFKLTQANIDTLRR